MTLPEPTKVSPLIKLCRYGLLIAGIIYGANRLKALKMIEGKKREERTRRKQEREQQLAEEKKMASDRDLANLATIFGQGNKSDDKPKVDMDQTGRKIDDYNKEPTSCPRDLELEGQCKRKSSNNEQISDKSKKEILSDGNNYHIETFTKGVPYSSPQKDATDFLPKS